MRDGQLTRGSGHGLLGPPEPKKKKVWEAVGGVAYSGALLIKLEPVSTMPRSPFRYGLPWS